MLNRPLPISVGEVFGVSGSTDVEPFAHLPVWKGGDVDVQKASDTYLTPHRVTRFSGNRIGISNAV